MQAEATLNLKKAQARPAELQAAQAQNQQLTGLLAEMTEKLAKQELDLRAKDKELDIRQQDADTKRLKEVGNAESDLSEETLRPIIEKLIRDIMKGEKGEDAGEATESATDEPDWRDDPIVAEGGGGVNGGPQEAQNGATPPVEGARQARDGQWYIPDAMRPGKYNRVEMNGQQPSQ